MARKKVRKNDEENAGGMGDFGPAISALCEEKGISKDKVIETVSAAIAAAYKKDYGKRGQNIRADFNEVSGDTKFFLVKEVVDETTREFVEEEEEVEIKDEKGKEGKKEIEKPTFVETETSDEEKLPRYNSERDLTLEEAKKIKKDAVIGDIIETELPTQKDYGRVAAQTAKQVIIQRIREAERDAMYSEYKNKEGEILNGTVQRIEGRNIFVDIGKSVGVLFPSDQVERESYRIGQRIKVYVAKVDTGTKGPGITLSRTSPEMVRKIFELEVPEIFAGTVQIKAIAREAGERTKIAVFSDEEGIDPVGSCVGQKGTRVQAVIEELSGEKIDIILWNEDIEKFISASLSPAKILKVELDAEKKEATATVLEDQLSLAIGKRGQNVRLAAKLTGWKIDIKGVTAQAEDDKDVVVAENVEVVEGDKDVVTDEVAEDVEVVEKEKKPKAKKEKKEKEVKEEK